MPNGIPTPAPTATSLLLEQLELDDAESDAAGVIELHAPVVVGDVVGLLVAEELLEVADTTSLTMVPGVKSFIVLAASHEPLLSGKPQHHVVVDPIGTMTAPPPGLKLRHSVAQALSE